MLLAYLILVLLDRMLKPPLLAFPEARVVASLPAAPLFSRAAEFHLVTEADMASVFNWYRSSLNLRSHNYRRGVFTAPRGRPGERKAEVFGFSWRTMTSVSLQEESGRTRIRVNTEGRHTSPIWLVATGLGMAQGLYIRRRRKSRQSAL